MAIEVKDGKIFEDGKETTADELNKKLDDLNKGTMMQSDYTRKTQELKAEKDKMAEFEKALKDKELSLAEVQELANTLTSNPDLAEEVKRVAAKYTKGGNEPAKGSQADTAMKAELKTLADEVAEMKKEKEQRVLRENYDMATSAITQAIDATDIDLTADQKEVLQNAAWMYSMAEHAKNGKLPDKENLNTYMADKVKKVFPMAKKMSDLKNAKFHNQPVGDNTGAGGVMTPPDKIPKLGSEEYAKFHTGIGKKIAHQFGLGKRT